VVGHKPVIDGGQHVNPFVQYMFRSFSGYQTPFQTTKGFPTAIPISERSFCAQQSLQAETFLQILADFNIEHDSFDGGSCFLERRLSTAFGSFISQDALAKSDFPHG
jgi:hypothetical protein